MATASSHARPWAMYLDTAGYIAHGRHRSHTRTDGHQR